MFWGHDILMCKGWEWGMFDAGVYVGRVKGKKGEKSIG